MQEVPIRARVVSVLVVRRTQEGPQFLLMRRASQRLNGIWCQVAGSIEAGETAWEAALREMREETGLAPEILYNTDRLEQFYSAADNVIELVPLFVAFIRADAEVTLNHEHSEHRWVSAAEALELLPFPPQRENIRHVQREFLDRTPTELLRIPF